MDTIADAIVAVLLRAGATRIFGVPGGDSSLDLIEAARRQGLPFVLARTECAAVLMAAASTEAGARIGVALTTKGPGLASAVNGIAHADLDRSPVVVISDAFEPEHRAFVSHQWLDQRAITAPLVRAHTALDGADPASQLQAAIDAATGPIRGPVHVELSGAVARRSLDPARGLSEVAPGRAAPGHLAAGYAAPDPAAAGVDDPSNAQCNPHALAAARRLLGTARRVVVVAGLECANDPAAASLRALVHALACPALVSYKAKGVIADDSTSYVGLFTGGAAEAPAFADADLIVLAGFDPVELIPQRWRYRVPVIDVCRAARPIHYLNAQVTLAGDVADSLDALATAARRGTWRASLIAAHRRRMRQMLRVPAHGNALSAHQVVEIAARKLQRATSLAASGSHAPGPQGEQAALPMPRVTVDAGAHMFAATALWPCARPADLLISNGLATMGFALPAAIGAALHEPLRPVLAFTGDGGLAMCMAELATAVEQRAAVIVIVFNDAALSLIDIKQQQRGLTATGVRTREADFRGVMRALGGQAWRAASAASLRTALGRAYRAVSAGEGPCLIDVRVDPTGYPAQMKALRG